eukprot:c32642_g1_i1.p1 GENE.c32642_g1_i1~~c32642_g1_i1.p1  ORF type:complete len:529 (+),score=125.61 c32642_g1_i1:1-1587(+)
MGVSDTHERMNTSGKTGGAQNVQTESIQPALGFALSSQKKQRKLVDVDVVMEDAPAAEERDYISNITDGQFVSVNPKAPKAPLVIPLRRAIETTVILSAGPQTEDDKLDAEARQSLVEEALGSMKAGKKIAAIPLLQQNQIPGLAEIADEKQKLEFDINSRPDEQSMDRYESTPIELFGEAMLRGMGWEEGKPVGLNSTEIVKPFEFVKRYDRGGIGSEIQEDVPKFRKYIKPGESREPKKRMRIATGADGKVRHRRDLDEELIEAAPTKLRAGVLVVVVGGRHQGLEARFISPLNTHGLCLVKLTKSGEEVEVDGDDLSIVDEAQRKHQKKFGFGLIRDVKTHQPAADSPPKHKRKHSRSRSPEPNIKPEPSHNLTTRPRSPQPPPKKSKHDSDSKSSKRSEGEKAGKNWVRGDIRVKVVSKKLRDGVLYMKKATVLDVVAPGRVNLRFDSGMMVQDVKEKYLETALPRIGGVVMMLRGRQIGLRAHLLETNFENNQGVIQYLEELQPEIVCLDDIAEFVQGDMKWR